MEQERTTRKKQELIEAMQVSHGIVTKACRLVGINCRTYYRWNQDPEFNRQLHEKLFGKSEDINLPIPLDNNIPPQTVTFS